MRCLTGAYALSAALGTVLEIRRNEPAAPFGIDRSSGRIRCIHRVRNGNVSPMADGGAAVGSRRRSEPPQPKSGPGPLCAVLDRRRRRAVDMALGSPV